MQTLSEFLAQYGDEDREAGIELQKVARLVEAFDRKGSVTVVFTVEKASRHVMVKVKTTTKEPRPDPTAGLFFVGNDGLTKDGPREQGRLNPVTGEITMPDAPAPDTTPRKTID